MNIFQLNTTLIMIVGIIIGAVISWFLLKEKLKRQNNNKERSENAQELIKGTLELAYANFNDAIDRFEKNVKKDLKDQAKYNQEKSKNEIGSLTNPINQALEDIKKQIFGIEKERKEDKGGLESLIEEMKQGNQNVFKETNKLVQALSKPQVRGNWGEIQLERIVEYAGMVERCHFRKQMYKKIGDTSSVRPDLMVDLPENKSLIIDSKCSLLAYIDGEKCEDETEKIKYFKKLPSDIRKYTKELSKKEYWEYFEGCADYIILFIPGDHIWNTAIEFDPELFEDALKEKVVIATPSSLIGLLKSIAMVWRQFSISDNAKEIIKHSEDICSRLSVFAGHFEKLGNQISSSVDNYDKAVGSFNRNIVPSAKKIKALGVESKRPLDELKIIEKTARRITKDIE